MLLKAIVEECFVGEAKNKFLIRIPSLETAGANIPFEMEAILAHPAGVVAGIAVNDIVIVGFENESISKPVILGKFFLQGDEAAQADAVLHSLEVGGIANLSNQTTIGEIGYDRLFNSVLKTDENTSNIKYLLEKNRMPNIRVTGMTCDDAANLYKLGVHVEGELQVGDEITVCRVQKSIEKNEQHEVVRQRWRYKVVKKIVVTDPAVSDYQFTINCDLSDGDPEGVRKTWLYNGYLGNPGALPAFRYIRVRRKILNNALYSNMERVAITRISTTGPSKPVIRIG